MRFQGEGEFNRCLNQDYPEKNNFRDSWGVKGYALFKCGDITVHGYINGNKLNVKSSVGYVIFEDLLGNGEQSFQSSKSRNYCKKNNCFKEDAALYKLQHWNSQKIIEYKRIQRYVFEDCTEITF